MSRIKEIESAIQKIHQRNSRVESDKAWETSWTRRILISILTYFVIAIFFLYANLPNPFANAIVPTIAFMLSTTTIPIFKKIWMRYIYKK